MKRAPGCARTIDSSASIGTQSQPVSGADKDGKDLAPRCPRCLNQVPLFSGLPAEACDRLEAQMSRRDYPPQTVIVREGGAGDAAFVILSGLVAVRRRDKATAASNSPLTELKPGEMFGEMALLTGKPRTATVVCPPADDVRRARADELRAGVALTSDAGHVPSRPSWLNGPSAPISVPASTSSTYQDEG